MNDNTFKDVMSDHIRERRESAMWNRRIAVGVLEKKRNRKRQVVFGLSSSLAFAAMVLFFLVAGLQDKSEPARYDQFISKQLTGTFNEAFQTSDSGVPVAVARDRTSILFESEIDTVIDETLALR